MANFETGDTTQIIVPCVALFYNIKNSSMAYEGLNEFTNKMAEKYAKAKSEHDKSIIMDVLIDYMGTTLRHAKFKGQKQYVKKVITEIEPAFAKGFFRLP